MEDVKTIGDLRKQYFDTSYKFMLSKLRDRQNELGFTNLYVADLLGIKQPNYERLISGKYPFSVPRLEQLCDVLGFGLCIVDSDVIDDFKRCVEEDSVVLEDADGKK